MTFETARSNLVSGWAPAKVNLYLHVGLPGPGGLHPIDSLVMFADSRAADRLTARRAPQMSLNVEGSGAKALKRAPNNLALAAAVLLRDTCDQSGLGATLTLHKELPIAGGVGGGSSDAAAALNVLNDLWGVNFGEEALERLSERLGSDVPACVRGRPLVMRGVGEKLTDIAAPDLSVVLVNPGIQLETHKVFQRFDMLEKTIDFGDRAPPRDLSPTGFVRELREYRNDLEPAAFGLSSEIEKVIGLLKAQPGCQLARMSGSGATCFGVFDRAEAAEEAALRIASTKKKYWVRATTLRGAPALPDDD